jgi:hypothetical protein
MPTAAFEVRRDNLRRIVLEKFDGNRASFSRAAGVQPNQVNLILTDNVEHQRNLGEALARKMESSLGIQPGWFDAPRPTNGAPVITVKALEVPPQLANIFRCDEVATQMDLYQSYFSHLVGKITAVENISFTCVNTRDMEPELMMGDTVMVDVAAQAITADGVYVLMRGGDAFLRRVTKQMIGGWVISVPGRPSDTVTVETLKGIKAAGRLVIVCKHTTL